MGVPLANITVESNGKEFTGAEFASTFPITTDQSVLPAAGDGAPAHLRPARTSRMRASIRYSSPEPLPLLGPEELPGIEFTRIEGPLPTGEEPVDNEPIASSATAIVDDEGTPNGIIGGPGDVNLPNSENVFSGNSEFPISTATHQPPPTRSASPVWWGLAS